jgi:HAE1 family hydrophobic/amphiphilic exporter-1
VRAVNESNLILPGGDAPIGPFDYNIYTNSQLKTIDDINRLPLKTVGTSSVLVRDVGYAKDGSQIQTNMVRIDGQPSVYLPVFKQGGDSNTISIVNGIKEGIKHLVDVPDQLVTNVVFDQSVFVKTAIETLLHEGAIGLLLTGMMILVFLGNVRATGAVFLSIPLSAMAAFMAMSLMGSSINSMILGGLALAFSRLIDNSVVVLENIFRHMELGESPEVAAEKGGNEVALPVLAATITTAIVFFPVTFLYGVSQFLFTALALSVVLSLFASYIVAITVVPLFCAKLISAHSVRHEDVSSDHLDHPSSLGHKGWPTRFNMWFNRGFERFLVGYERLLGWTLRAPVVSSLVLLGAIGLSFLLWPLIGTAYFPRTDPGQFVINVKTITGTRLTETASEIGRLEALIRREVSPRDLRLIVSNIGSTPGFSSLYTSNSATHTAFVQVSLNDDHTVGSYAYMDKVREAVSREMPELTTYFQSGGLVDAVLNLGLPAPIDVQVSGSDLTAASAVAQSIAAKVRNIPGVSDVLVPQDIDAPSLQLNIDRTRGSELGLSQKEIVSNVITALTSNAMIAPSYWVDPKTGNDYLLTVQYPENTVKSIDDLRSIPLHGTNETDSTRLDMVAQVEKTLAPTEIDHYQLRRTLDVYVATKGEAIGRVATQVQRIIAETPHDKNLTIHLRGSAKAMTASFSSFGFGLLLAVLLVYLVLVAQFRSFLDPFLILLAVPPGLMGVTLMLVATGTTLNIMSLMGIVMMVGIVVSNSILIVEFTHRLINDEGLSLREAVSQACRVRLRPILMTSLATLFGLLPMALKLGTGSESYAPLARAIIGGLGVSVVLTVFLVPAAFLIAYRGRDQPPVEPSPSEAIPENEPQLIA